MNRDNSNTTRKEKLTQKRQQEILDAAMRVFAKKGFNGATTKEIAGEAGLAEGTIFRYFKTKKDILLGLVGPYVVKTLIDTIEEVSGEQDEVVLAAIIRNRLDLINKNKDLIKLLLTESQFHPELKNKFTENIVLKAAGVLEKFIAGKIKTGEYSEIDPQIASRALVGMVGIFVVWREFLAADKYIKFDEETVVNTVVEIFLNGVRKNEAGGTR